MKRFGSELIFISRIYSDGHTIELLKKDEPPTYSETELYKLNCLSISHGTYIASGMSSYVVKLKNPPR